jgi:hypothetical protein
MLDQRAIDAFHFQADQAFYSLKRAHETRCVTDIRWANQLYEGLCTSLQQASISELELRGGFRDWPLESMQSTLLRRVLLEYELGRGVLAYANTYGFGSGPSIPGSVTEGVSSRSGLTDLVKRTQGPMGTQIMGMANDLATVGRTEDVLFVMEYVQGLNPKPTI